MQTAAVGAAGAAAALSIPQSAQAGDVACAGAFTFPETFSLQSLEGGCETSCRIAGTVTIPDFMLDVVNTFGPPASGVSPVTVDLIMGSGTTIDLGGAPSGNITFANDPAMPGGGTMDFNLNQYHTVNPVIITLAAFPGLQFQANLDFIGTLRCVSTTYPGETGTFVDLVLEGTGTGVLPPEFPYYGGAAIELVTTAIPTSLPAFGPLGLLTAALGLGAMAVHQLKSARRVQKAADELTHS